jgi:uncharacterized membrane protein
MHYWGTHGKIVNYTQNLFARIPMIKNAYDMLRKTYALN